MPRRDNSDQQVHLLQSDNRLSTDSDSDSDTTSSDDTTCEPGPSSTARATTVGARGTANRPNKASDLNTKRHDRDNNTKTDSEWLELDNMDPNDPRRPNFHRGKSGTPLLHKEEDPERGRASYSPRHGKGGRSDRDSRGSSDDDSPYHSRDMMGRPSLSRRSTMRSRSPQTAAEVAEDSTKKRYTYAAFFLAISLVSFCVQTELSSYIQNDLGWGKAYCMMYLTHGSWVVLWPIQLLILRYQKRDVPWPVFWKRHKQQLRTTAIMIEKQTLDVFHLSIQHRARPVRYFVRFTVIITCALTVAGLSWYVAVALTTPSDLTAIYNCSAFFAYVFSVPLLHEPLRLDKSIAVLIAIAGVLVVAYGDTEEDTESVEAENRFLGNLVIGIGSVLYGLYEVLYKRYACPPEGCSPGRGMIFANTFGSLIGIFTLTVLWIPLPILDFFNIEKFEIPATSTCWLILLAVLANATFSGSFLVLISLTSPVLSSVAALLTIFLVAIVDWMITGKPLSFAAIAGGSMIIVAFLGLTWSTYREMKEHAVMEPVADYSDSDKDGDIDSDDD
ncbi:NADP-dependent oxidoreductase domain-containing protein [Fusarium acuminatum]